LTPMEMRLENERLRMTVAELGKSDNVVKKVLDILDNIMQQYDDSFIKSHDITERVKLFNKWKALKDFREELEKILEEG
jgi:hypothetical protein